MNPGIASVAARARLSPCRGSECGKISTTAGAGASSRAGAYMKAVKAVISGACSSPRDASSLCKMIWRWLSISGLPVDRCDARPPQVRRADHVLPGSGYLRVVRLERQIILHKLEASLGLEHAPEMIALTAFIYAPARLDAPAPAVVLIFPHSDPRQGESRALAATLAHLGFIVLTLDF